MADPIVDLVYAHLDGEWGERARSVLTTWAAERYGVRWDKKVQLRVNGNTAEDGAPYAALIPAGQPSSGPYGGMSFVLFPSPSAPALVAMVVGTNGLAPDELSLGRPGHARKVKAICRWLNRTAAEAVAWAKQDPVRIDLGMPTQVEEWFEPARAAGDKYDKVIYGVFRPRPQRTGKADELAGAAVNAFADLFFEEHGVEPLARFKAEKAAAQEAWTGHALPVVTLDEVRERLLRARFVILEGPPGTGKTRMAEQLRGNPFQLHRTVQFHPSMTYELFVGGLAPERSEGGFGFQFRPRPGILMDAAILARMHPEKKFLLHIDEINRADLAKVLGEAIYLFERGSPNREISLPYDFGEHIHDTMKLPENLYVLGTMNSADRSIAILDVAVRRRFAFVPVWPDYRVLEQEGASERAREAFQRLFTIFIEEASDDALALMPGHAYFLDGGKDAHGLLNTSLKPLLQEYLIQGYVSGFADSIRAYLDWLDASAF